MKQYLSAGETVRLNLAEPCGGVEIIWASGCWRGPTSSMRRLPPFADRPKFRTVPQSWNNLGNVLKKEAIQLDEAIEAYRVALGLAPDSAEICE